MSAVATDRLYVAVERGGVTVSAGDAFVTERRRATSMVFDYDTGYLANRASYSLSPDLPMTAGRHPLTRLPGSFADSAPNRWGRNLIAKRVRAQARADGGAQPRKLREVDYLLGVSDLTRQGALRFSTDPIGPYLGEKAGVPNLLALPTLLAAADVVAADGENDIAAVKALLDAGSGSLGGARPKASVHDGDRLLIAKFPHHSDEWDVMAWEKTALDLAEASGIRVPGRRLELVGGRSVLLLDRFDRNEEGRIGYISAMTLLGHTDGMDADYTEVAEALSEHGTNVVEDLAELWRRIAFSLVINNVDDHLRNHGFLREGSGWRLSPMFDVNPNPDLAHERVTSIGFEYGADAGAEALMQSAADFGLNEDQATGIWAAVLQGTASWRAVASRNGVSDASSNRFAPVLNHFRNA